MVDAAGYHRVHVFYIHLAQVVSFIGVCKLRHEKSSIFSKDVANRQRCL